MSAILEFPKPKKIEIPLEKDCLVVDKRELDLEDVPCYIVAKVKVRVVEVLEFNRVVKRMESENFKTLPLSQLIPVVLKPEAAKILLDHFTDGRTWSNGPDNLTRYLYDRQLIPLVPGKKNDRRGPLFDADCLNKFLFETNGKLKENWNMLTIPESDLKMDVPANELADIYQVSPDTIRAHRRRLRIPPPKPGRLGSVFHGALMANYTGKPITEFLSGENLAEYNQYDDQYWKDKVEEYWNKPRRKEKIG